MPRTEAGAGLTEAHRRGQLQIRARVLRAYLALWPMWRENEPDEGFNQLAAASVALVWAHHRLSSAFAAAYYSQFRISEGILGRATPRLAATPPEQEIVASLRFTGEQMTRKAVRAGASPAEAREKSLVRTSGTIARLSLGGGRDTLLASVEADPAALGHTRVTDGDPCAFCRLLASRGPVYKQDTAGFEAHDHCGCAGEPYYPGSEWPGLGKQFRDEYNEAIRQARANGQLRRGTTNDQLNALRRYLEQQT